MKQTHPERQAHPGSATPIMSLQELQRQGQQLQQETRAISAELDGLIADLSKEWQLGEDNAPALTQCGEVQ